MPRDESGSPGERKPPRASGAGRPSGTGRPSGEPGASASGGREDRSSRARRTAGPAPKLTEEQKAEIAARYDPRREKRRQEARVPLPDDVDPRMLDAETRTELRSLSKDTADLVARHLVMAGRLIDED